MHPARRFPRLAPALLVVAGCATAPPAERTIVIPNELTDRLYASYQYAPAVRVGDTVYVSGIPAGPGPTYEDQARTAFERLGEVLQAAGAGYDDVVEITTYHVAPRDSQAFGEEFAKLLPIHREFFRRGYPAWTAVGTTVLLAPGAPFELRAIAVVGAGKNSREVRTYRTAKPPASP